MAREEMYKRLMPGPWRPWQKRGLNFLELIPAKGKTILDVGGRTGWAARRLKERGADVLVMDIIPESNPQIANLTQSGIPYTSTMPFIGEWDIIWCHHVLEHVPSPIEFLCRLRTIGKELWLAVPRFGGHGGWARDEINLYTIPILIEHLRRSGWDVQNCSYRTYWNVLQIVVRRNDDFIKGLVSTYSKYPESLRDLNNTGTDYEQPGVITWNWCAVQRRGSK